jgi:hypothetical protein
VFPRGLPVGTVVHGLDGGWHVALDSDAAPIDFVQILLFSDFAQLADAQALAPKELPTAMTEEPNPSIAPPTTSGPVPLKPSLPKPGAAKPATAKLAVTPALKPAAVKAAAVKPAIAKVAATPVLKPAAVRSAAAAKKPVVRLMTVTAAKPTAIKPAKHAVAAPQPTRRPAQATPAPTPTPAPAPAPAPQSDIPL